MLQQGPNPSTVWGTGTPGASVTVTLSPAVGSPSTCSVDGEGLWMCLVGPVTASFQEYTVTAVSNGNSINLTNVLFGDVWVCPFCALYALIGV